ncbi:MAG: hypothetical protein IJN68_04190 [Clostridia bacterium]|nr:hypothetical protein [Clostridia bacterium]
MKKFLAVIMALIMSFSVALVPAYAAEAEEEATQEITVEGVFNAIETAVILIKDTIEQVHNIVGQIMGILGKECAMCGEIHEISLEDSEIEDGVEDEVVEDEVPETTEALAA